MKKIPLGLFRCPKCDKVMPRKGSHKQNHEYVCAKCAAPTFTKQSMNMSATFKALGGIPISIPLNSFEIQSLAGTDDVNHPAHYTSHPSGVECIAITRHMGFNVGNVIKYCWRADRKNGIQDLKKARWYLDDEIAKREKLESAVDAEVKKIQEAHSMLKGETK